MKLNQKFLRSAVIAALCAGTASAHHSVSEFDRTHMEALSGTVKQFVWANPHCWIYLLVPDGKGGVDEWDMEGPAVNGLARNGWSADVIKPGMKVRLKIAPRRDGKIGGDLIGLLDINGVPFHPENKP